MIKKIFIILAFGSVMASCTEKATETISLSKFSDKSKTFVDKIKSLEAKLDPTNVDTFMQINDSIAKQQTIADSVLAAEFTSVKDTIFLDFTQTQNIEKIKITKVWVTGVKFNELQIQASVEALDNSSFKGPYTSCTILDKTGKKIEVGGGIGGPAEEKLETGKTYIFSGAIDNLHLLGNLKTLTFDEKIKKW